MHKEFSNSLLRDYRVDVLLNHGEGEALAFLSAMEQNIEVHLNEELVRQHGLKYAQVLTNELEKLAGV